MLPECCKEVNALALKSKLRESVHQGEKVETSWISKKLLLSAQNPICYVLCMLVTADIFCGYKTRAAVIWVRCSINSAHRAHSNRKNLTVRNQSNEIWPIHNCQDWVQVCLCVPITLTRSKLRGHCWKIWSINNRRTKWNSMSNFYIHYLLHSLFCLHLSKGQPYRRRRREPNGHFL